MISALSHPISDAGAKAVTAQGDSPDGTVGTARGGASLEWSLRRYLEVLYREPGMNITLCGLTVC